NRGDFDVLIEVADPDIVLVRAGGQPELRGAEALRAWLEPDAFESQVLEPTEFRVAGNRVLMRVESTVRGAGSGIETKGEDWSIAKRSNPVAMTVTRTSSCIEESTTAPKTMFALASAA